jgi:two-component system, OmpR family, aerobic respiration control sensor histidine kinase ArcB
MEHDIRTPFVGVYGMINLLAERETDSEKKSILSDVSLCAKELLDYCDSILDFSKIEAQSFPVVAKAFNLKKLVDSVMTIESIAAKHKKLNFSLNYDNELPPVVIGDPYRLKRILINLISNAIKFTKEGFVRLSASVSRQIPETRNLIVNFSVSDSGIGIPKDKKELIYERFTRVVPSNKGLYKGQGLGLRIVKQFVDELDGDIHLKSEVGEGSTFTIFLALKIPLSDEIIDEE